MKTRQVLISINLGGASGRDCLAGMLHRINSGFRWNIRFEQDMDRALRMLAARSDSFDGVITEYPPSREARRVFAEAGVPVVFTKYAAGDAERLERAVFLQLDDEEIGRAAYRYFKSLGKFGSWVFATEELDAKYSVLRQRGFRSALAQDGRMETYRTFAVGGSSNRAAEDALAGLPRPIAIFAAYDPAAFAVLNICRQAGVAVPRQASILGVDNDEMLCTNTEPSLSSILPNHLGLGARSVEELNRLMNGGRGRTVILPHSMRETVGRKSTRVLPPAEHLIESALDFISRNAESAMTVADVVKHLKVSRPLADLRFRELHGETIGRTIAKARLKAVQKRLRETDDTAGQIARACGFRSVSALSSFFKREVGRTLSAWRIDY